MIQRREVVYQVNLMEGIAFVHGAFSSECWLATLIVD
jgi:hypothetical protein